MTLSAAEKREMEELEELEALEAKNRQPKITAEERREMEELEAEEMASMPALEPEQEEDYGVGTFLREAYEKAPSDLGNAALWVGDVYGQIGANPSRGFLDAALDGKNPLKGFRENALAPTSIAPSGKQIMQKNMGKVGIPDGSLSDLPLVGNMYSDPSEPESMPEEWQQSIKKNLGLPEDQESPRLEKGGVLDWSVSGAGGLVIDTLFDWTNILPVGKLAKGVGILAGGLAEAGTKTAAMLGDAAVGGGRIYGTVDAATKSIKNAGQTIKSYFNPTRSLEYPNFLKIARKYKIEDDLIPSSIEFGPNSFISRAERSSAEGPLGQAKLERHERFVDRVKSVADSQIQRIGKGFVRNAEETGQFIRKVYNDRLDEFFDTVGASHMQTAFKNPGLKLSKRATEKLEDRLSQLEQKARNVIEDSAVQSEVGAAEQILGTIEKLRAKGGDYSSVLRQMQSIGRTAFKVKNGLVPIPPDIQVFRQLYRATSDALIDTAEDKMGKKWADALRENNRQMSIVFGDKSLLANTIGNTKLGDNKLLGSLILSGDSGKINSFLRILKPEDIDGLKGAILEALSGRTADGDIVFKQFIKNLHKKKDLLAKIFTPDELGELDEILKLGDAAGSPVMSTSGSSAGNAFTNLPKNIANAVTDDTLISGLKTSARKANPLVSEAFPGNGVLAPESGVEFMPKIELTPVQKASKFLERSPLSKAAKVAQVAGVTIGGPQVLEGYLTADLEDVPFHLTPSVKSRIQNSTLSTTEKARALNLITKHGKVPSQYLRQ